MQWKLDSTFLTNNRRTLNYSSAQSGPGAKFRRSTFYSVYVLGHLLAEHIKIFIDVYLWNFGHTACKTQPENFRSVVAVKYCKRNVCYYYKVHLVKLSPFLYTASRYKWTRPSGHTVPWISQFAQQASVNFKIILRESEALAYLIKCIKLICKDLWLSLIEKMSGSHIVTLCC